MTDSAPAQNTPDTPRLGATVPVERERTLDVLRGFALLGILLVNVQLMAGPQLVEAIFATGEQVVSQTQQTLEGLIGWFVAGKFVASFSILFGVGAAIIASRATTHGRAPVRVLLRRYVLLILAGIIHFVFLFPGDILFYYGITGLILLAFLRRTDKTLAVWAVALTATLSVLITLVVVASAASTTDADFSVALQAAQDGQAAYTAGSYTGVIVWNLGQAGFIQTGSLTLLPLTLALFLVGMLAFRRGLALSPKTHRATLVRIARVTLPLGLLLNVPLFFTGPVLDIAVNQGASTALLAAAAVSQTVGAPVLAIGYLTTIASVVTRVGTNGWLTARLAALGQIALTGYLTQSIAALVVFFGFRRYGQTTLFGEPILGMLVFVIGVWVLLLVAAPLWTRRFAYGPFEWVWRYGTYGTRPLFRRSA